MEMRERGRGERGRGERGVRGWRSGRVIVRAVLVLLMNNACCLQLEIAYLAVLLLSHSFLNLFKKESATARHKHTYNQYTNKDYQQL